jgi:hypothetical protein
MRELVEDERYRHLPIRSLAILAQRVGRVFAAYGTWVSAARSGGA